MHAAAESVSLGAKVETMAFKLALNPARHLLIDVLIVAEAIKSEKKVDIKISWNKTWHDKDACLYDKDDNLLEDDSHQISRYLARTLEPSLYGPSLIDKTKIDHWMSCAKVMLELAENKALLDYLDKELITRTWLVSKKLTLADIYVFCVLERQSYMRPDRESYCNITRWYNHMSSLPAFKNAMVKVVEDFPLFSNMLDATMKPRKEKQTKERKQEGKFIDLPGAEMGKVVVRFPPEASGYLHIGHAKAALLNQYYAETFQGQLIMRFDDTNPAKETVEFEEAILEDLKLLQIRPDRFTHTSDYFEILLEYCTTLIKNRKAYVDGTPADLMKEQRDQRLKSKYRDNSVDENLALWEEMKCGTEKGQEYCVRAKIDYESTNGCMRDPTIYRCKPEYHPRTGNKYKVYPTYDFACPIVDAIEDVTHTLRTTEYHDRDTQFYWIIEALGLRRPYIWEYSRLNMTRTVLSKRKLTWFVNEGLVDGWDDPRFPTVRGILRRGMTVEGLKQFIIAQGSSRSVVFMEWDKIWAFNKKVIDPVAVRYTALDYNVTIPVNVVDAKEEWLTVQNHPKDSSKGTKQVRVGPKILIEKEDAERLIEGQNATFINWGNLMIQKINKQDDNIVDVEARLNLEDKSYKNTLKITWLAESLSKSDPNMERSNPIKCYTVYFGHIMSVPVLGKDDDFKNFVAEDTRKEAEMLGEVELKRVKKGEIIQLQRKGFFICDVPYAPISPYSSREQPVILFHIPDGHTTTPCVTSTASRKQEGKVQCVETLEIVYRNPIEKIEKAMAKFGEIKVIEPSWKLNIQNAMKEVGSLILYDAVSEALKITKDCLLYPAYLKEENMECVYTDMKNFFTRSVQIHCDRTMLCARLLLLIPMEKEQMQEIVEQKEKIQKLKKSKADKSIIDREIEILANLESIFKYEVGYDWTPYNKSEYETEYEAAETKEILEKFKKGNHTIEHLQNLWTFEMKLFEYMREAYKSIFNCTWQPVEAKPTIDAKEVNDGTMEQKNWRLERISKDIKKQDIIVRNLKRLKIDQSIIDQEVKVLSKLKSDYKNISGQDWEPDIEVASTESNIKPENKEILKAEKISEEIKKQGDKVRSLKTSKVDKKVIDLQVKILLSLKSDYKNATGQDWDPANSEVASKKKKQNAPKAGKTSEKEVAKNANSKDAGTSKTGTRLGLEAKKEENFVDWYSQVITKSGMIEYYDVSGCYILRPWSFAIWKMIKEFIDKEITAMGVQECYFPIFVTRDVLEKEKTHIANFAPEVAWVTKSGDSNLAEPIAIRPTSETVMYPAYAKWLKSDTELPLKLNQWNNVVRWEFKDPKPFLRTREFLWQEGHTAFADVEEAEEEVMIILDMYARVYENLLAVPVIKGRKTEKEKFAGGEYTTTVEAFISTNGRAIQGATSHHLGQNFSKMFNIQVESIDPNGCPSKSYVYQNSWGLTTRTIGVMIMVHGDDRGLVLPPRIAPIQAVVIPCGIVASMPESKKQQVESQCAMLVNHLCNLGKFRVKGDFRNNRTPGWKFNHWELKGVPIRIELGPRDLEKNQVTFVRRDNFQRKVVNRNDVFTELTSILDDVQQSLLFNARRKLSDHIKRVEDWNEFKTELDKKNLLLSPFCGNPECEDNIKQDSISETEDHGTLMGAKSLCIPFQQPPEYSSPPKGKKCIHPSCKNLGYFYTFFGRSY